MKDNLEQKSGSGGIDSNEQVEHGGFLYRLVEGIMQVRKAIRDSQPYFYREFNL
jgi:hypothetical protein